MICILFIIAFSMVKAESIPDQTIELLNVTDKNILMDNTAYNSSDTFSVFGIISLPTSIFVFNHSLDTAQTFIITFIVLLVLLILLTACILLCWCRKNGVKNIWCFRLIIKYHARRSQKRRHGKTHIKLNGKIYREKKIEIEFKKRAPKESIQPKEVVPDV